MSQHKVRLKNQIVWLLGLYFAICLIRFLLALATSAYPMVNIDEFLYYGMARSMAEGKGLMFRGQLTDYSYILYSLVLSPVFLLGLKGPMLYRMMQLWNILIISSSLFPIYYLAKDWIKEERKALFVAGASMLLPDFMLGQLMMTENVVFPLFFMAAFIMKRYLEKTDWKKILLIGILGGLMFSAKPGAVIPAAVFLFMTLGKSILKKDAKECFKAIAGILTSLAVAAVFFWLVSLLGGRASVLSLYDVQVADGRHIDVFIRFIWIYILYIILASGIACVALAVRGWSGCERNQKFMFVWWALSLAATIIGVAWSVNRYEYNANTAHMRYIGMYIPLLFLISMIPDAKLEKKPVHPQKANLPHSIVFGSTALLLLIVGIYAGVNAYTVFAENMTMAVLIRFLRDHVSSVVLTVVILGCISGLFMLFWKKNQKIATHTSIILLLASMILNNAAAYGISKQDTRFDYAQSTQELMEDLSDADEILYLYTVETTTSYFGALDVYSPQNICYTTLNDLFNQMYASRGVYVPFMPEGHRGNNVVNRTPDTDTIVMDATVYCMLGLSDNTSHFTCNENALHAVKILDRTKPWLDWVIGNTKNTILSAGNKGILLVFNESLLQTPLTFKMTVYSERGTTLSIYSNQETRSIELGSGRHEYEVTFDRPLDAYNFEAAQGDIRFYGFDMYSKN